MEEWIRTLLAKLLICGDSTCFWTMIQALGVTITRVLIYRQIKHQTHSNTLQEENLGIAKKDLDEQIKTAQENSDVNRQTLRATLIAQALEQLESSRRELRLIAIHILGQLAEDSQEYRWPITELLTAYIREQSPAREGQSLQEREDDAQTSLSIDLQAILTVLGRRRRTKGRAEEQRLNLAKTDLRGANLDGAHLERADLRGAYMQRVNLNEAWLEGALLNGAHLQKARLDKAHLEGTNLAEAHLQGAHLSEVCMDHTTSLYLTDLQGALLVGAHLKGARFFGVSLQKANLDRADLQGALLSEAHLEGAGLDEAHLEGADLSEAHLEGASLRGAYLQGVKLTGSHLEGAILAGKPVFAELGNFEDARGLRSCFKTLQERLTGLGSGVQGTTRLPLHSYG